MKFVTILIIALTAIAVTSCASYKVVKKCEHVQDEYWKCREV